MDKPLQFGDREAGRVQASCIVTMALTHHFTSLGPFLVFYSWPGQTAIVSKEQYTPATETVVTRSGACVALFFIVLFCYLEKCICKTELLPHLNVSLMFVNS